ncbi:MAG: hypothetical protein A4E74_02133 [Syntrophus sp. PtaB.Bin075]|nr:MAG: hypothetical protein A4E74_02133 [Syntrophus sp. PtaB.Bin075]
MNFFLFGNFSNRRGNRFSRFFQRSQGFFTCGRNFLFRNNGPRFDHLGRRCFPGRSDLLRNLFREGFSRLFFHFYRDLLQDSFLFRNADSPPSNNRGLDPLFNHFPGTPGMKFFRDTVHFTVFQRSRVGLHGYAEFFQPRDKLLVVDTQLSRQLVNPFF